MTQPAPNNPAPGDPAPPAPQPNPPGDPAPTPAPNPDPGNEPLGPAGLRALQEEREARKRLEQEFAPLRPLLAALGGGKPADGKTELEQLNERFAQQEKALADERLERWRAEVLADKSDKGLTPVLAKRLVGATREELAADADELLAGLPTPPVEEPRRNGPRPDPAQGPRPGERTSSLDAGRSLYAERHAKKSTTT